MKIITLVMYAASCFASAFLIIGGMDLLIKENHLPFAVEVILYVGVGGILGIAIPKLNKFWNS